MYRTVLTVLAAATLAAGVSSCKITLPQPPVSSPAPAPSAATVTTTAAAPSAAASPSLSP